MALKTGQEAPPSEEELLGISEELCSQAPYFPEEVYRHLPFLLHRGVEAHGMFLGTVHGCGEREREFARCWRNWERTFYYTEFITKSREDELAELTKNR